MCLVKTPKLTNPASADPSKTEPTVIRNPYLDGVGPVAKSRRMGRSSLRISRTSGRSTQPNPSVPPIAAPGPSPTTPSLPSSPSLPGSTPVRGGGGLRITPGRGGQLNAY